MRALFLLFLVFLPLLMVGQTAQKAKKGRWLPGVRGGLLMVPYEGAVPTLATGVVLGVELTRTTAGNTRLLATVDYTRVTNLEIQEQSSYTGVLANEAVQVTSFKSMVGYSAVRLGLEVQPGLLQGEHWKLGWQANANFVSQALGRKLTAVNRLTYDHQLTESSSESSYRFIPLPDRNERLDFDEYTFLVFSTGPTLSYQFTQGPRLRFALLYDLNRRLVGKDVGDSRLNHLEVSFHYPLISR